MATTSFGLSRRAVIGTAAAALALYACPFCAGTARADHDQPGGCMMHAQQVNEFLRQFRPTRTSGNGEVDQLCATGGTHLRRLFDVNPDFAFFDDTEVGGGIGWGRKGNALATPARMTQNSDGTVLMGLTLVQVAGPGSRLNRRWKAAVISILAHEWAHIVQYKRQIGRRGRTNELQADFLAGWFLGRTGAGEEDAKEGMWQVFGLGDRLAFTDPQHHGTPVQRAGAITSGYEAAASAPSIDAALARGRY